MSALLENIPLVQFIKTTYGNRVVYSHNLTREFIDDLISLRCARSLNIVLPLENKIHIFTLPCKIPSSYDR